MAGALHQCYPHWVSPKSFAYDYWRLLECPKQGKKPEGSDINVPERSLLSTNVQLGLTSLSLMILAGLVCEG